MTTVLLLKYSMFAQTSLAITLLAVLSRKKALRRFYALSIFLSVLAVSNCVSIATLFFRPQLGIPKRIDYNIYAYSNWIASSIQYALVLLIIYGVFSHAMKPLQGLHRAGKVVFRWVYGVSLALVMGMALGPHGAGASYVGGLTGQIQQGVCVLTLCLLLFVCFATRYLGLTYRSHIFGVSLGLGIWATTGLIETAWYASSAAVSLYSPIYLFSSLSSCAVLLTWGTYFALPEPQREMVLLPTTSPYFLWNRISEALGDEPGFVAIAGFKPDMLAPAELSILTAANKRVREREVLEQETTAARLGGLSPYHSIAMQR